MDKLEQALTEGYRFEMGKYMGDGWDYFKKGAGNFIGFMLVFLIISIVAGFTLGLIPIIGNILTSILNYILIAGVFIYTRNMLNGQGEFGDFFGGFNYVKEIVMYSLVYILLMLPAFLLVIFAVLPEGFIDVVTSSSDPQQIIEEMQYLSSSISGITILWILLAAIYLLYIGLSYSLALIFIVDRNMGFWDAMEASRKLVGKNFLSFLFMFIILGIIMIISAIPCGLGLLVTVPFTYTTLFAVYDTVVGAEDSDMDRQVEEFGNATE